MKTLIAAAAAVMMTGLTATAVYAQPAVAAPESAKVFYGDLDLTGHAGMQTLKSRIHHAAYRVCGVSGTVPIELRAATTKCLNTAIRTAMQQVPSPEMQVAAR